MSRDREGQRREATRIDDRWRHDVQSYEAREARRDVTRQRIATLAKFVREGRATLEDVAELDTLYFDVRSWL